MHCFNVYKSGIPGLELNFATNECKLHRYYDGGNSGVIGEIGSIQMEFAYLSYVTGDLKYFKAAYRVYQVLKLKSNDSDSGVYKTYFNPKSYKFKGQITVSGLADSFYEYLLKLHILSDRSDNMVLGMYNDAMQGMKRRLTYSYTHDDMSFHFIKQTGNFMEHLACFIPGLLTLGNSFAKSIKHEKDLSTEETRLINTINDNHNCAVGILRTCVASYYGTKTGLGPEHFYYNQELAKSYNLKNENKVLDKITKEDINKLRTKLREDSQLLLRSARSWDDGFLMIKRAVYLLRPETIESIYVLYRYTNDPIYQDIGWDLYQFIETYCKTDTGYASLSDINC